MSIPEDFLKVKHNSFRGKQYLLSKRFIFINQGHNQNSRLLKLTVILTVKSHQPGKEILAKVNEKFHWVSRENTIILAPLK